MPKGIIRYSSPLWQAQSARRGRSPAGRGRAFDQLGLTSKVIGRRMPLASLNRWQIKDQYQFALSTTLSSGWRAAKRRQFSIRIASHLSRYGVP